MKQLDKRLEKIQNNYRITKQVVKIKFNDFNQTTAETISSSVNRQTFVALCEEGYARRKRPVRLLGIGVRLKPRQARESQTRDQNQLCLTLDGQQNHK